jgi:hypothetical protein
MCPRLLRCLRKVRSDSREAVISPVLGKRGLRVGQGASTSDVSSDLRRVVRRGRTLVPRERRWVIRVLCASVRRK